MSQPDGAFREHGPKPAVIERLRLVIHDASVQGWANHVRYADAGGLRRNVLAGLRQRARND